MNSQRIEGAVALVTGANRGIGRALTEALLTRGVRKVYATARNPEALRALRDERLVSLRLDVTDADQIRAAAEAASESNSSSTTPVWRSRSSTALRPGRRTFSRTRSRWILADGSGPRRRPRNGSSPQWPRRCSRPPRRELNWRLCRTSTDCGTEENKRWKTRTEGEKR